MCEMWGHSRGFSVDWPRLKNKSKYYKKGWLWAYSQSNLIFFNLQLVTDRSFLPHRNSPRRIKSAGFRAASGMDERQNGERRSRGSQGRAHQWWRQTEMDGFRRGAAAGGYLSPCRGGAPMASSRLKEAADG
jgi:hypothetical protein